jgi:GntR family transcriptional regulator, transcriptional repressor for pyruvate dehydrogenase complex
VSDRPAGGNRFEPVVRRKTYELVAERLLTLVSSQHLAPGDLLPSERELVTRFSVGRSSIREALRMLESKGVITSEANGGFVIAPFGNALNHSLGFLHSVDQADVDELFEVRRIIEGEAAALAAGRRTDDELGQMGEQIRAMMAGIASEEAFAHADLRFHLLIAEASRNRLIAGLMDAIRALLQRVLALSFHVPGSAEAAIEMHRQIVAAIAAGQPDAARAAMAEHLARSEHEVGHGAVGTVPRRFTRRPQGPRP